MNNEDGLVIRVVDSIMGSGKTTSAIEMMKNREDCRFIYITPYLNEVERVKSEMGRSFHEPKTHNKGGRTIFKQESFHDLLREKKNIVSTHSLFSRSSEETKELIYANDYILILDEVMDVVEKLQLKKDDLETMLNSGFINIDEDTGLVTWKEEMMDKETQYNKIKDMMRNESVYIYGNDVFMWTFPVQVFKSFKEIYNLTYLFDAQVQKYYYDMNGLTYEYYHATKENDGYVFKKGKFSDKDIKCEIKELVNIYDGNLNKIGDKNFSLSKSWYSKRNDSVLVLKNNTENFFKNIVKAKSRETLWTTYKDHRDRVKGRGYSKSFVPLNLRATNEYKDRDKLAYTVNLFMIPLIKNFFHERDVEVNEDLYALSELLQWVWRSAIRDKSPIDIYIPSKRMRELFIKWLNDDF